MFALSGMFLVTVGLISCDNDVVTPNEGTSINTQAESNTQARSLSEMESLKVEFSNLLLTEDYIDASTSTKLFSEKLKIEGYNFENEDDLINWINSNPDSIEFSSPSEAISQYTIVKNKWINFYDVNSSFFTSLVDLSEFEIGELVKVEGGIFIGTIGYPNQTTGCWGDCIDAANQCNTEAQEVYQERLAAALLLGRIGFMPGAAAVAANALIQRNADDRACARGLYNCVDACD